jgi:hypothetical protein
MAVGLLLVVHDNKGLIAAQIKIATHSPLIWRTGGVADEPGRGARCPIDQIPPD